MMIETVPAKTIITKTKGGWFGNDYNMNIYRGCCHGCIYCDSRSECYGIDRFDTVRAKENALGIIRDELRRKVRSGVVGTGSMSDPYNPFEKTELLTRHALELINAYGFGADVLSKSALIARDTDIFREIAEHSPMLVKMTVTACDDELCRLIEPNVSVSSERFDALAKIAENGIFTGIMLMPVLPFIEDTEENIIGIVRAAHKIGARFVYPAFGVTLRANQREYFLDKLDEIFPEKNYRRRYEEFCGGRYECVSPNAKRLWKVFTEECGKYGILYDMGDIVSAYKSGYGDTQLSFF